MQKFKKEIPILIAGGVGVLPTDTLYGLVGSALDKKAVERVYKLRKRSLKKPFIVLISSLTDLKQFSVKLHPKSYILISKLWPGKVSVVLPVRDRKFAYLHRGTKTIAFRLPKPKWLRSLLKKTGPLVAPSANREGELPALTIAQAKKYFGPVRNSPPKSPSGARLRAGAISNGIDFYLDKGKLQSKPSTLVNIERGKVVVLREGAVKI